MKRWFKNIFAQYIFPNEEVDLFFEINFHEFPQNWGKSQKFLPQKFLQSKYFIFKNLAILCGSDVYDEAFMCQTYLYALIFYSYSMFVYFISFDQQA